MGLLVPFAFITRARASAPYVGLRPRPEAITNTANPRWLNRSTSCETPSREKPESLPACVKLFPAATANRALARLTVSIRSLLALATRWNARCSA